MNGLGPKDRGFDQLLAILAASLVKSKDLIKISNHDQKKYLKDTLDQIVGVKPVDDAIKKNLILELGQVTRIIEKLFELDKKRAMSEINLLLNVKLKLKKDESDKIMAYVVKSLNQ